MDQIEAARRLGVAESEVVDIRADGGWWQVLHHDMASHEETWRVVPGRPEGLVDESAPTPAETAAKPAPKRRGRA